MAANVVMRTIEVSGTWTPLAPAREIVSGDIRIWYTAAMEDYPEFRIDAGDAVTFPKNVTLRIENVDLSRIQVRGNSALRVSILGYTR